MRTTIKILALTTIILSSTSVLANEHYRCKTDKGSEYSADVNRGSGEVKVVSDTTGKHHDIHFAQPDAQGLRQVVDWVVEEGGARPDVIAITVVEDGVDVAIIDIVSSDGKKHRHHCRKHK